jgi:molybdenum cofactor cytidylyltransferase
MKLSEAMRLSGSAAQAIALVGAGGKTTALFQLARELAPVLVSTTTHLGAWQVPAADRHIIWQENEAAPRELEARPEAGIILVTGALEGERYQGLGPAQAEKLHELAKKWGRSLLIEADGARRKTLKAPAEHEPVIPNFVDCVLVVAGLAGLNMPLTDETVHRAKRFRELAAPFLDEKTGTSINGEMLTAMLAHPQGGLKNIPTRARRLALLNQADTPALQAQAGKIASGLLAVYDAVVVSSLQKERIWTVHERIAGIVLAAGAATRFGGPKQLLDYHGQSFVRKVAQTGLEAGLSPVIVVTGAHAELVEAELHDLPVVVIHNPDWQQGQSTSVKTGLNALPANTGGAIYLLADQPQVTPHVIGALVERHAATLARVIAPLAGDRRANPVLFDRATFGDLHAIRGDSGGRVLFTKYQVEYVPWHDESLLLDVDTEDDYRNLLAWGVKD